MIRTVVALLAVVTACTAASVSAIAVSASLLASSSILFTDSTQHSEHAIEDAQRIQQTAFTLGLAAGPLAAAAIAGIVAILVVLAMRWEFRRRVPAR